MIRPTTLMEHPLPAESVVVATGARGTHLCPSETAVTAPSVRPAPKATEASAPDA